MRPGEYVVVLTGIDPSDVITAKTYFRSSLFRDFYYVEMTYQNGEWVGILPQPSPDTPAVIYYLEALDSSYNIARSREYDAEIRSRCRQDPAVAYFPGGDTAITVGATSAGAPALPPGFAAAGIAVTVTAAGISSGIGSGIGAGTAVALGAAAAAGAGAGVAVLSAGDGDTKTSSIVAVVPPSSAVSTSTAPAGPSSTTAQPNPAPGPGTSTTIPTSTVPGGVTTTIPRGTSTTTVGAGTTTTSAPTTSSSSSTTTTTAASFDASCFTVNVLGACRVRADATCVTLPVDQYEWTLDLNNRWEKVEILDGPASVEHTWTIAQCEDDESIRFKLKVRRGAGESTAEKNFFVPGSDDLKASPSAPVRFDLDTSMEGPGSIRGRILVNGAHLREVDNSSPATNKVSGRRGANSLTAIVVVGSGKPATWRFAFDAIVPGSLEVVSGNVVAREPSSVVVRLTGHPGERIELRFVPRE